MFRQLTLEQARIFILAKQGLIGAHRFQGKDGALAFVRQARCVQFDPIDVCGRNADLVLQSRVKGYQKTQLDELLYKDRLLIDFFDKNLAIIPIEDWPFFEGIREYYRKNSRSQVETQDAYAHILSWIHSHGSVSSKDLKLDSKVDWYWSPTNLSRAALETLYFQGELIVHHKKGTNKYYALTKDHLPVELLNKSNPFTDTSAHHKWRVLRRIAAVGLLWAKASDAFMTISDFKAKQRMDTFAALEQDGSILLIQVDGIKEPLYILASDAPLLEAVLLDQADKKPRCEFIAPLDSFMWDRKLIEALFGFSYKWEIYTPEAQRQYGYYVLPILYGSSLIGRIETYVVRKDKTLLVKNVWLEPNIRRTKIINQALDKTLDRFRQFNGCEHILRNDC